MGGLKMEIKAEDVLLIEDIKDTRDTYLSALQLANFTVALRGTIFFSFNERQ